MAKTMINIAFDLKAMFILIIIHVNALGSIEELCIVDAKKAEVV